MLARAQRLFLVVALFVCPLLFFTNLTRNPYVTQISLLNVCLAAAASCLLLRGAFGEGRLRLPRTPLDAPILVFLGVAALSWAVAYFGHAAFFRPAMRAEGLRNGLFLLVNCLLPYFLAAAVAADSVEETRPEDGVSLWPWVVFVLVWGVLWLGFSVMRQRPGGYSVWNQLWDPYGGALWIGGIIAAYRLCRRERAGDYLHLALAVGTLAALYGVFQYFGKEFIWPNVLNPYGGRSVSTFGNPNFLSSFLVMLLPAAFLSSLAARGARRWTYAMIALTLEAALLCSLTRSSWIGAAAAFLFAASFPGVRQKILEEPRSHGLWLGLALALALLWPQTAVTGAYTPSVIGRLTEHKAISEIEGFYSPLHQRVLIWTCSWLMGAENPLTGKGWGLFELFYPFYQGAILNSMDFFRRMRTHANNSHNEIMETWAQVGLLGLGVVLWQWTLFFTAVRKRLGGARALSQGQLGLAGLAAAAGVAGMLVDNLLNVSLHFAVPAFLFWWLAGSVAGRHADGEGRWRTLVASPAAARAAALAVAVALGAAAWYWVRVWNREVHYFAGFKLLRQGQFAHAIRELENSRRWGPREVNALYELGNAYARAEKIPEAVAAFEEALTANAGYDEIYFNAGTLLNGRMGVQDKAERYYELSRLINPWTNEVYMALSALYLREPIRDRPRALDLLQRAVHFAPNNANHWNNLGYVLSLEKRFLDAESAYVKALEIAPEMDVVARNLAGLSRETGRRPAILDAVGGLRELDALVARKDYSDRTLALAKAVAERLPELGKARFLLGSLLLARNRPAEAAPHLEWVVAREPVHAAARSNLANTYLALGRREDGIVQLKAALAADSNNGAALAMLKELGAIP